ncbi:MAG: hypothetical protein FWD53_13460, partial [Phycisphaerales bacterium]|nr:hypothetical protein [Phycisphaerales bacterium]
MKPFSFFLAVTLFVAGMTGEKTWANDWPQWRGANRDGVSNERGWLTQWPPEGPKQLWEATVDRGMSSFAVANGKVYTQGFRPERERRRG